jgi:hypothetical protein
MLQMAVFFGLATASAAEKKVTQTPKNTGDSTGFTDL